jgi:hypothetical protein
VNKAIEDIAAERQRQIDKEGWTPAHDDTHNGGELAIAAAHYASFSALRPDLRATATDEDSVRFGWPFDVSWWKPTTPRRDLVKAAALIVAEIERLDRAM